MRYQRHTLLAVLALAAALLTDVPQASATPPTELTVGLDMKTAAFNPDVYSIVDLPDLESCVDVDTDVNNGEFYVDVFVLNVSDLFIFNADLDFTSGQMQIMESSVNRFFSGTTTQNLSKNAYPPLQGPLIDPYDPTGSFFAGGLDTGGGNDGSGVLARLKAQAFIPPPGGRLVNFQIATGVDDGVTLTAGSTGDPYFLGDTTGNDGIFDGPFINPQGVIAVNRPDGDSDGTSNDCDNCVTDANADQSDIDGDGVGDACDPDIDGDGYDNGVDDCPYVFDDPQDPNACLDDDDDTIANALDNCPNSHNTDQSDIDADGQGDVCDLDMDGDGFDNGVDNCPTVYNPLQDNVCTDFDEDGIFDAFDNCPFDPNTFQTDDDADGQGNACDNCPDDPNNDYDGDFYCVGSGFVPPMAPNDNCPFEYNPSQSDIDGDGLGAACDNCPSWHNVDQSLPPWTQSVPEGDDDCDGWTTGDENFMTTNPDLACGTAGWPPDLNDDQITDIFDINILKPAFFTSAPGPPYQARLDLVPNNTIDIFDVNRLKPVFFVSCTP